MREYLGKFTRDEVLNALSQTRITPSNADYVLSYLVDGVRLRDMPVSKQQVYARVEKVVNIINAA